MAKQYRIKEIKYLDANSYTVVEYRIQHKGGFITQWKDCTHHNSNKPRIYPTKESALEAIKFAKADDNLTIKSISFYDEEGNEIHENIPKNRRKKQVKD